MNNIDAWVGILAEDHVRGGSLGATGTAILVNQFTRLRDGDRFWYQNTLSGQELRRIENTTLADVIQRNTDIAGLQDNVFFVADAQPTDRPNQGDRPGQGERPPRPNNPGPDFATNPNDVTPQENQEREDPRPPNRDNAISPPPPAQIAGQPSEDEREQPRQQQTFVETADELFGELGLGDDPFV